MVERIPAGIASKQKNYTNIFQLLRKHPGLSRQDIVVRLQLSLPTVTQNLEALLAQGLVEESGTRGNTGGRRAKLYSCAARARTAIGLDITQSSVSAVAVDLSGSIIAHLHRSISFSRTDAYYRMLGETIDEIIDAGSLDRESILGVGIGLPAMITPDKQTVYFGKILQITGVSYQEFAKYIPFPTALYNDANAAGFAESWARPELHNFFYISLSNHMGGSIYINNQPYYGDNIRSGEIGAVYLASHKALHKHNPGSFASAFCESRFLSDHTGGDLSDFFSRLERADPQMADIWKEYLQNLSATVFTLRSLFDCTIILGGYVGEYIEPYIEDLKALLTGKVEYDPSTDYILPCAYKQEAIAAGAALHFISQFIDSV